MTVRIDRIDRIDAATIRVSVSSSAIIAPRVAAEQAHRAGVGAQQSEQNA